MTDAFQAMIDRYCARMAMLRKALEQDGRLLAVSAREPQYSILLTRKQRSPVAGDIVSPQRACRTSGI